MNNVDKVVAQLYLAKKGAAPVRSYDMHGELYKSQSGWILLNVPNSLVRGAFDALNVVGAELPPSGTDGTKLNAHISVMRPEELESIGGADKISERGKHFSYRIRGLKTVKPRGWDEMSRVWMLEVHSPELENLRKSYGLTAKPKDNKHEFHITIGVKRKHVLNADSGVTKQSDLLPGGKGDDRPDDDFDYDEIEEGVEHEQEHTDRKDIAKEIAKDHLTEDPKYYEHLDLFEKMHQKVSKDIPAEDQESEEDNEDAPKHIIVRQTVITISGGDAEAPEIPKELADLFFKKGPAIPKELEEIFGRD